MYRNRHIDPDDMAPLGRLRGILRSSTRQIRGFSRDDDGAILAFGLIIFSVMLLIGGLAIDTMRHETLRTRLQNTTDGSVLAAASLTQTLDSEAVVYDFFDKAGQGGTLQSVDVTEGINFRSVAAVALRPMNTFFLHMIGIEEISVPAAGAASERIPNVEISLVLDISGSMRFTDSSGVPQIEIMRPAASGFIEKMLEGDRKELISISIVPYAGSVNPGQRVFNLLDGVADHGESHCMEFSGSDFNHAGVPSGVFYEQVPHFMHWRIDWGFMEWGWCPSSAAQIQYHNADVVHLTDFVDNVPQHDGTGTHFAMRWGLALLDPSSQWLTAQLVADGDIEGKFSNRPAAFDDPETLKAIVLMTDGAITDQFRPRFPDAAINETLELLEQNKNKSLHCEDQNCHTTLTNRNTNRSRFYAACDLAKANGITVYTIAFNTTSSAAVNEMQNCASTPSHYYNVTSHELNVAFQAIAGSIQMLRLTQ